jgi:hypothetical protein
MGTDNALTGSATTWSSGFLAGSRSRLALSQSLMALSYYTLETNAALVLGARRWLAEVLHD